MAVQVTPEYQQQTGDRQRDTQPAAALAMEEDDAAAEQQTPSEDGAAAQPASAAVAQEVDAAEEVAAAEEEDAQEVPAEQHASLSGGAAAKAGAACQLGAAAAATAEEPGGSSSGPGNSGTSMGRTRRVKQSARKGSSGPAPTGRTQKPPTRSNLGPQARQPGGARKSTQRPAAETATALAAEGQPGQAPEEAAAVEEELQGASQEDIARVDIEYGLTAPHEVRKISVF